MNPKFAFVFFLALDWSNMLTTGSIIIGVLLGLAGLAIFGYGVKYKTAYESEKAVAASVKEGRDAYELRSKRMAEELDEAKHQIRENLRKISDLMHELSDVKAEVARLEERPNLERVLEIIGEQSVREDAAADLRTKEAVENLATLFAEKLKAHDQAAEARQTQIIELLRRRVG